MKRLLLFTAILCGTAHAQFIQQLMQPAPVTALTAPTMVQVVGCPGVATAIKCTISATTAGNTAYLAGLGSSSVCSSATMGVGGSVVDTFLLWQTLQISGSDNQGIFIARNISAGNTEVDLNCTGANSGAFFLEYSPSAGNVVAADVIGMAGGTSGTPSATTVNPVGLATGEVIGTMFDNSAFHALTAGTGYTMQKKINDSGGTSKSNCTTTCLAGVETNTVKTSLSGTQTATMTGPTGSDNRNMSVVALFNTPAQDPADTIINFEGCSDGVAPTVSCLNTSTFGVPGVWSSLSPTNMTASIGAQMTLVNSHQIGATAYTGSGSLGLRYATGTPFIGYRFTFYVGHPSVSMLYAIQTSLPQNCTNLDAYSLEEIENSTGADFYMGQLQCNGSAIHLFQECGTGTGSQNYAFASNTKFYIYNKAVNNAGTSSMMLFDSTGAQVGTTSTCTAVAGTNNFTRINFGITGAESEHTGSNIDIDNMLISYGGASLSAYLHDGTIKDPVMQKILHTIEMAEGM